ncbi:uncharacterized protein ACLA_091700 [Aspergillus clavatus NRRL 1]|uniref:Uncharacterized protein n=1 Tax=Aspergillus clavatus (strain ATCC 1007 / CBS 513.65 / DSM 816 / NCTC 3887 / NRRL 1 / QM 1276 / 107) TaxID=344612 RepID=A1CF23_ASPCL|nr:uncharacterized protein ACLA_091700 [Aspergillus clavatus NRRL 1]EAW11472.1 hypothetical protein ACLA_091700 [Aspergillus clavatus NRRL 1]
MEATAPYLEHPPKRKRESSLSQSGPANESRGAKPIESPNQDSTQPEPPTNDEKVLSVMESFRPLARELERLDEKDPILAAQAARLVALYRRLWESYVAKNAESQRLDKENQQLKNANASLSDKNQQAEHHFLEYNVLLSHYKEAHQKIENGINGVLEGLKGSLVDSADAAHQKQDG